MAALTVADELFAAQKKLSELAEDVARAKEEAELANLRRQEWEEEAANAMNDAAEQVEAATRALNAERS
jgi:cell division protein ZapA (FtsZ GTPase activity inhibitor)